MSCETEIAGLLRKSGQRPTPQRLMILSILRHSGSHLTAAQILEAVRKEHPYVDISTVYRTMSALKDLRVVSETDMGSGEYRYEWMLSDPHHHLVCCECGRELSLGTKYFEQLRARLLADHGFDADINHLAVFGVCKECREKTATG